MKRYSIFILILLLIACDSDEKKTSKAQETKPIVVKTTAVTVEKKPEIKSFFGTLKFSKSIDFMAQESGIVSKLSVQPGNYIQKGTLIALYPPKGHHLQVQQAAIQKNKSLEDYNRQIQLYNAGAVSKASIDDFKTQLDIDTKTIHQLQEVNTIRAPFSGIITQVHTSVGQEVSMGSPIVSMAQNQNIEVEFYALPDEISKIQISAPVYFTRNSEKVTGKVIKKALTMNPERRAFLVTAAFENSGIEVAGELVDVQMETTSISNHIWIPVQSFRKIGNQHFVYILNENKAKKKSITIGTRNEAYVEVISGLTDKDVLITEGIDKLEDNVVVEVAKF